MLTRLRVSGFKNLVDVDVRFGPFTCIAGPNGVGKSNLFDAILFLSASADRTLMEAAKAVRDESNRAGDIRAIFHRVGDAVEPEISFEAEMILPSSGVDELGQSVSPSNTFVRYKLRLRLRSDDSPHLEAGQIEILEEALLPFRPKTAETQLLFEPSHEWIKSVLKGQKTNELISTESKPSNEPGKTQVVVGLHQDLRSGRKLIAPAATLPRTMLSTVQAGEYPTAMLVRREMQSWRQLHLESTALRKTDSFTDLSRMGADGSHLPATLYHLARRAASSNGHPDEAKSAAVYARVANRLAELIEDVREVSVERDETQQRLILCLRSRDGTIHQASALSDGTLRFLALAVAEFDGRSGGLVCFEEPENGIHPRRIPAMLRLLEDIASDPQSVTDEGNPLRQVIINTHSPSVVRQVPESSLLVAELVEGFKVVEGKPPLRFNKLEFGCLNDTWRAKRIPGHRVTTKASLLAYLNPAAGERANRRETLRVMDRPDLQQFLSLPSES